MEGPLLRLLLLVAGLLAAVLPAAAAATTFGPQPGAPCEPTLLATQVSLFCAPNMLSAQCCEPVVAAVDLGGGVPCLCRVAAEPRVAMAGFNPKYLLALYISCGGRRNVSAHLAAACEGPASPAADVFAPPPSSAAHRKQPLADCAAAMPTPPRFKTLEHASEGHAFYGRRDLEGSCDQFSLGEQLADTCGDTRAPSKSCCKAVLGTIDMNCLCQAAETSEFILAGMDIQQMWSLYRSCRGTRPIPADRSVCRTDFSPPPPPPLAPPPPHPARDSPHLNPSLIDPNLESLTERLTHLVTEATVGTYVAMGLVLIGCIGSLFTIWKLRAVNPNAAVRNVEMGQQQQAGAGMENLGNNVQNLGRSNNVPPPLPQRGLEAPLVAKPSTAPISDPAERFKPSAPPLPQEA
ncbi:hypothetical protein ACQ4PT_022261 [Festuca glaucescens]